MPKTKEQKKEVIARVTEVVQGARSAVFVNFHGLSVQDSNAMRRDLRKEGIGYFVAKKTLMRRALASMPISGTVPELQGEIAICYGADAIAPARTIAGFAKKFKDRLSIVGGIFEGAFRGKADMQSVAAIPPIDVLYAQVAHLFNSPIQGLVVVLDQIARSKNYE